MGRGGGDPFMSDIEYRSVLNLWSIVRFIGWRSTIKILSFALYDVFRSNHERWTTISLSRSLCMCTMEQKAAEQSNPIVKNNWIEWVWRREYHLNSLFSVLECSTFNVQCSMHRLQNFIFEQIQLTHSLQITKFTAYHLKQ